MAKKYTLKVCEYDAKYILLQQRNKVYMRQQKVLTLKTLNKSNVWDIQENDVFRMWEAAEKEADLKDNARHYVDIIRSAFEIEEVKVDRPEVIAKYEERGFKVGFVKIDDNTKVKWAIKKRPILRVTDLTYENIHHISASKLLEVIERNFGGGWIAFLKGFKISLNVALTSAQRRFLKIVFTSQVACMKRKLTMDMRFSKLRKERGLRLSLLRKDQNCIMQR